MNSNWADPTKIIYTGRASDFVCEFSGRANNGRYLSFTLDSRGFQRLVLSLEFRARTNGFTTFDVETSTDGTNYVTRFTYTAATPNSYEGVTVDLRGRSELDNVANAQVRLVFDGATTSTGQSRIDNVVFGGEPL
jgi:hypothetical protein